VQGLIKEARSSRDSAKLAGVHAIRLSGDDGPAMNSPNEHRAHRVDDENYEALEAPMEWVRCEDIPAAFIPLLIKKKQRMRFPLCKFDRRF
jgi:hypothetical protein